MSIKKLFQSTDTSRNYLSDTNQKDAFKDVESAKNVAEIREKQTSFIPPLDYSEPKNFVKYGSANLYYKSAIDRIIDYFPYDGSDAEINGFYNESLNIEKYIFDNDYPRTNGYALLSADGWGGQTSTANGYGLPDEQEYIAFKGGPHTITSSTSAGLFDDPATAQRNYANVYDADIYTTEGLESNYGTGSRESNLESNFDKGVTIEFWLKKDAFVGIAGGTKKEVIFDMWNGITAANQHDYARLSLSLVSSGYTTSPFILTVRSGSNGFKEREIGSAEIATYVVNGEWKHYALTLQNSGSDFISKLYVTGALDDINEYTTSTIGALNSKNTEARIGALLYNLPGQAAKPGAGKLSASMDEFRFWKAARNGDEIYKNWFTQVRGGTNTDISNTTLGVYYKFNEGITGTASIDNSVLDYSGRITNGNWVGYDSDSRSLNSAIVQSSASATEYKDPIIRSNNPDVISLKDTLEKKGANYDFNNNASFQGLIPSWVVEEADTRDGQYVNPNPSNIEMVSHILGTYFDNLRLMIQTTPKLRYLNYASASNPPTAFAQHLPQSLGLYMPEIFVDANVMEKFLNRTDNMLFEGDLTETKNLIYQNIYNNLTNIYKSKGTEKAIRNVLRCFNIDDKLIRLNVYSDKQVYELKNNLRQTLVNQKMLNFNESANVGGVVYQAQDPANAETFGYISGSEGVGVPSGVPYESKYGFTAEADVIFPNFEDPAMPTSRQPTNISLFGMCSASTDNAGERPLNDTTWYASDNASFQVFAIRDEPNSKNVKFQLTSAFGPDVDQPFPTMASETFYDVYDDQAWNFSVRLKPSQWPLAQVVTGATAYTYDVIFKGINAELGVVRNSFELSSSITKTVGQNFLKAAKRLYIGARKHNLTGSLSSSCDVIFEGARYWLKYLDDLSLNQHAYDIDNYGISGSYQYTSPFDINLQNSGSVLNSNMLALNWNFGELSSSDANGSLITTDISSGSAEIRNNYGWVGEIAGYQMAGSGSGWSNSSQTIIQSQSVNAYQFINPEIAVSSDMIQILSEDDTYFGVSETPPQFTYLLEKSMYNAISEEMLNFFAGVVDFNNVIGEPINRYRGRYKTLEKLREIFFRRVTEVKQVEKFIEYYKWFDDAIAEVIGQLLPASGDFTPDAYNTIESHVLERNKYRSKFPMLDYEEPTVEGLLGSSDAGFGSTSTVAGSPRPTNKHAPFWEDRALRSSPELTSGDATIDSQRDNIRRIAASFPTVPQALPNFKSVDGTTYKGMQDVAQNTQNEKFSSTLARRGSGSYWGGTNFPESKNLQFTLNALRPGGPVNTDDSVFVPKNVLLALTDDLEPLDEITANVANFPSSRKLKRIFGRVQHGRDWEDGSGYANTKSTYSFPFNIMSSSVVSGYNKQVINRVTSSIEVTNLHNDVYGPDMEVPMQGPFTEHNVGGMQSRHVSLNTGSVLDTYLTRPEAWKILLGRGIGTGAIGMAGPDYPWPEANALEARPYPMTGSQKAIYYRGFIAKRPVNIRNITSSMNSVLGNYTHAAQVVQSVGTYSTPRHFLEYQPPLPTPVVNLLHTVPSASTNVVGFFPWIRRTENYHFNWDLDYTPIELTGTTNKTVFVGRFAAPGGPDVMSRGFLDIRGAEYSPYNALPWRNLSVLRPWQPPSGTISQATGSGVPGIRVYDIHGKSYGLNGLLARHSARFGRDSIFETASPGATYNQLPSFQQNNRNRWMVIKSSSTAYADDSGYSSGSQFDNAYVVHPIPRSDRQYSWFTSSLVSSSDVRYYRFQPTGRNFPYNLFSGSSGYVDYFDFITGSAIDTSVGMFQPTTRLNIFTLDPVTSSTTNVLGYPSTSAGTAYFNSQLIEKLSAADSNTVTGSAANYFNLLMTRRGNTYGWNWQKLRQNDHPILVTEMTSSKLSLTANPGTDTISSYTLSPVSLKGRPVLINLNTPNSREYKTKMGINNLTLKATDNNKNIYYNNNELDNLLINPEVRNRTAFDKLIRVAARKGFNLQWVLYSQAVYPSNQNEFLSRTTTRTDYNNEFWRDTRGTATLLDKLPAARTAGLNRQTVGSVLRNSFSRSISQSCWALDAQENFLTRTAATLPVPIWHTSSIPPGYDQGLVVSGAAGELQNNYFFYWDTDTPTIHPVEVKYGTLAPGALYARKHMLESPKSVSPWTNIPETGSNPNIGEFSTASMEGIVPEPYAGEAFWEADTQAGRVIKSGSQVRFEVTASKPWFNNYDDFRYDLKLMAKDYSIIPEFRISEHVEDYINYGVLAQTNTFEIPGTSINSTQDNFYKDYSNSEFMKDFANIPSETRLNASGIRLVMSAAIRFNPYKGFYPAQRSLNLVSQFSKSYGTGFVGKKKAGNMKVHQKLLTYSGSLLRPLVQPLFAPGILYNTIKAGCAVDYPVLIDDTKFIPVGWTGSSETTNNWALLHHNATNALSTTEGYNGGEWYDQRLPFEAIIEPESHIKEVLFIDCEPHPSVSLSTSASFTGESDGIYSKMSTNFFGEIANFFLKNQEFSTLKSGIVTDDLEFERGDIFGARIVMQRTWDGERTYGSESGSAGDNTGFTEAGAQAYSGSGASATALRGYYPIPQDPIKNVDFKPKFVPYTRPTAYGPPVAGRPAWSVGQGLTSSMAQQGDNYGVRDGFNGHAWAYTPPYFYGEAWCDLIFRPVAGQTYSLERILSETSAAYWRADPGGVLYASDVTKHALIPKGATGSNDPGPPYGGANINSNAMQLSASVNIFGVERVTEQTLDEFGNLIADTNKAVGKKWVIQSKFETPMMNFSDNDPVHPISTANSTLTLPTYGSASVPRGMWHQFGVPPTETDNGVFLKIGDIPTNWLKYHYDVITNDTIYNNNNAGVNGKKLHRKLKSLPQLMGFERNEVKTRLGELASKQIIKEAVVAVPYITENVIQSEISSMSGEAATQRKKFISIPKERLEAAMSKNTATGDSLDAAGASIRELVQKMGRYVLPPQFDFINNPDIRPMVMYLFEFEYELDKDDLAYIWQNLAPRDYQKISLESYSVAHDLINTELLDTSILEKENLRWLVFKIKQRASSNYYDKVATQLGEASEDIFDKETTEEKEYEVMFNWPYDYVSIVEMAKLDVQVLYKK